MWAIEDRLVDARAVQVRWGALLVKLEDYYYGYNSHACFSRWLKKQWLRIAARLCFLADLDNALTTQPLASRIESIRLLEEGCITAAEGHVLTSHIERGLELEELESGARQEFNFFKDAQEAP